ncbi:MAG: hypothetical protein ACXAAH_00895 [Promethearchaeota archaeon]|jgi:hypothetical protein
MQLNKNNVSFLILGLIGPILLILSEFFPWFSDYNLVELFIITTFVEIENSFLFLFPLISGIICLIASMLVIYNSEFRIKTVILSLIGLGFQLIFFIDYISQELGFLTSAGVGIYLGSLGFLLIIINVISLLTRVEKVQEVN